MALIFDGDGAATGAPIVLTGDFRIDLPNFTLDYDNRIQLFLGCDGGRGWIGVNSSGELFFQGQQSSATAVSGSSFSVGVEYSGVYLERVGSTLTVSDGVNSESVSDTGDWNVSYWGGYGDHPSNFREPWTATGQGVISGSGVTTTIHDFDNSSGSTLNDLTGSNDWTLQDFTTGGFEGSGVFTSQPSELKIFPRSSAVGGLFNKGEGAVSFTYTGAGTLTYRLLDEDGSTEVIAAQSFTSGQEVTFNAPANAQWYKIEILKDGVQADLSNKFGVGGATYLSGQSLAVRMMRNMQDSLTLADVGVSMTPYHSSYLSNIDQGTFLPTWAQFEDGSDVDSAFGEFLNQKVAREGVVWALVGHAKGGTPIEQFDTGSEKPAMQAVIDEVGGVHEFIWFQGHSDTASAAQRTAYQGRLQSIYDWLSSESSTSFDTYTLAISNIDSNSWGSVSQEAEIRKAHLDFCNANGATFVNAYDIDVTTDGVHQGQHGNLSLARNFIREQYGSNYGASFSGFSRNGSTITVYTTLNSGATELIGTGDLTTVVDVSTKSDPYTFLDASSVAVSGSTITVELSSDPGTNDLLIWFGSSKDNDGTNSIRDDYTADGFAEGRSVARSIDYVDPNMVYLQTATPANQPPVANAGPDQSVAAATQFTLDGTGSQDTDGTVVEWRWTQTAGDTVTLNLEDPARPTATSPSKTTAQRLTFQLVTVDDEGAASSPSLVNIDVAAVVQNDVLNIIDKISFTFESDGMITAFPGRANRETFRLKPSDPTGLVLEDGWFDFEANDVRRVEISMLETTGVKIISSNTDSITRERSKLHVRMGDMPIKSSTKEFEPTVSVFVGDDERGVVMTAPGLSGAPKVKYYSTTARAV